MAITIAAMPYAGLVLPMPGENRVSASVGKGRIGGISTARVGAKHQHRRFIRGMGLPLAVLGAQLLLGACASHHPEGQKQLLMFLTDGTTTKAACEAQLGVARDFNGGRVWTYRIGEDADGYWRDHGFNWVDARYSLVLEFDAGGVLRRHALIDVKASS